MTRPTKDAVDSALAVCDRDQLSASSYPVILADEVRALRDEAALDFRTHVVMVEGLTAERDALQRKLDQSVGAYLDQEKLLAEIRELRRNAELHNDAANAAELRIVELRAELAEPRSDAEWRHKEVERLRAERDALRDEVNEHNMNCAAEQMQIVGLSDELTELREAAEAVHALHAETREQWLSPEMRQLRAVLAKLQPSAVEGE